MEWSIHDIARLAGTTSRTLRHYGAIGLLQPSRIGSNGYRYYSADALTRLQRILLLRELGLSLPAIAEVLTGQRDHAQALLTHLEWLQQEKNRLDRQIASVETTILKMEGGEQLMAEEMFDGFDHTQYKDEVEERWGKETYAKGDAWWRGLTADDKQRFLEAQKKVQREYAAAFEAGLPVDSNEVMAITARHYEWVAIGWQGMRPGKQAFVGLGDLYVADERFAGNYGGPEGAQYARDAMAAWAERELVE